MSTDTLSRVEEMDATEDREAHESRSVARESSEKSPTGSNKSLERLMKMSLLWRSKAREACEKLRQVEFNLRTADEKKRRRIEKTRNDALDEYRNARTEAARARTKLLNTLRTQPSRS